MRAAHAKLAGACALGSAGSHTSRHKKQHGAQHSQHRALALCKPAWPVPSRREAVRRWGSRLSGGLCSADCTTMRCSIYRPHFPQRARCAAIALAAAIAGARLTAPSETGFVLVLSHWRGWSSAVLRARERFNSAASALDIYNKPYRCLCTAAIGHRVS